MNDQSDNKTQVVISINASTPIWQKIKTFLCPCLMIQNEKKQFEKQKEHISVIISNVDSSNPSNLQYKRKNSMQFSQNFQKTRSRGTYRKTSQQIGETQISKRQALLNKQNANFDKSFRQTISIEMGYNNRQCSIDENDCSICNINQNYLISRGINDNHLLIKVSTANININLSLLKRQVTESYRRTKEKKDTRNYGNFQFNKFWDQRYLFFDKFDQGIKIDQNSWAKIPLEQVCDYIANICHGAKVVLDGFAGVGSLSIRLASCNYSLKVIANDYNSIKLDFLHNNAKVYEVDRKIHINQQDFLKVDFKNIDIVCIQPPLTKFSILGHRNISITDFEPTLDKVILKSFKLAPNLLMLLPPQMNIDVLSSCINKCANELNLMKNSCSVKIQKIYCQKQIKFILVSIGKFVQTEIKLSDQLEYIYNRLKKPGEKYFKHKKVIKKIRQYYGMLQLFSFVKQSEKRKKKTIKNNSIIGKQFYTVDSFYQLIQEKNLISPQKLVKLIDQQNAQGEKQQSLMNSINRMDEPFYSMSPLSPVIMEEQKIQQNPFNMRETQYTRSDYSHYTIGSTLQKKEDSMKGSRSSLKRINTNNSSNSVIINRTITDSKEKKKKTPQNQELKSPKLNNKKKRMSQIVEDTTKEETTEYKKKYTNYND